MSYVTLSVSTQHIVRGALALYRQEVEEIISTIKAAEAKARQPSGKYVTKPLVHESECVARSISLLSHPGTQGQLESGFELPTDILQVMHSALTLFREDLEKDLRVSEADPLFPPPAAQALKDRLRALNDDQFWQEYGVSPLLNEVRRRRILKSGVAFPRSLPLDTVLVNGEGQEIEFMREYPGNVNEFAKEIAAFASSNPGTIYLGVADDGMAVGLDNVQSVKEQDTLRTRVEGVCSNAVVPSIVASVEFATVGDKTIAVVGVPKGSQPVYYSNQKPYVRHGSSSRPAHPQEVIDLVQRYLAREK